MPWISSSSSSHLSSRTRKTLGIVALFAFLVALAYHYEVAVPLQYRQQGLNKGGGKDDDNNGGMQEVIIVDQEKGEEVAVFVNTKEDKEAQVESEAYFEGDSPDGGEGQESDRREGEDDDNDDAPGSSKRPSSSSGKDDGRPLSGNLSWPTRYEDYSPLNKGSFARKIFNDAGETMLDPRKDYASPGPRVLSTEEKSSGVHVVTTFFHGSYENRRFSEIVAALVSNLENPYVSFVHALWEKEDPTQYIEANAPHLLKKLVAVEAKAQPTYSKLFKYVNDALLRGSVAIVTNADIYFDSALRCLKGPDPNSNATELSFRDRTVFALSRRHTTLCGKVKADHGSVLDLCQDYIHSHDAFVFAPPVPNQIVKKTNHMQNRYGGENIVIWEFTLLGYKVMNPCKKVHAIHLHCSAERHYVTRFIDGFQGNGPYRHGTVWPGSVRIDNTRRGWRPAPYLECGTPLL